MIFLRNITSSTKHTHETAERERKSESLCLLFSKKYLIMIFPATEAAWIKKRNEWRSENNKMHFPSLESKLTFLIAKIIRMNVRPHKTWK